MLSMQADNDILHCIAANYTNGTIVVATSGLEGNVKTRRLSSQNWQSLVKSLSEVVLTY